MISNSKNYGEVKLEIFFTDTFKRGLDKAQVSAKSSPALDKAAKTAKYPTTFFSLNSHFYLLTIYYSHLQNVAKSPRRG